MAARWIAVLLWALVTAVAAAPRTIPKSFWHPEIAPAGPLVMVVSLDEQQLYVYRNGVAIGVSPVSSGKPGYDTPTGVYTILQKEREHYSNLYDDAPMPYMQRLTWDGVALHAGCLPGRAASHGCIRLPATFARELYTATRPGDVVVVADARVAPPASCIRPRWHRSTWPASRWRCRRLPAAHGRCRPTPQRRSLEHHHQYRRPHGLRAAQRASGRACPRGRGAEQRGARHPAVRDGSGQGRGAGTGQQDALHHRWSGYRIRGSGPVPEPAELARHIHLPRAFGEGLRAALRPGTTVLVTDLPGYGRSPDPSYGALLESARAEATSAN